MNRIVIIGISGTGKTRLAQKLSKIFNIPIVHYDEICWGENWTEKDEKIVKQEIEKEILADKWVLEGYIEPASQSRLKRADLVIYLDYSGAQAFWGGIQRWWRNKGKNRPELASGCIEKFDWDYLKIMWNRNERVEIEKAIKGFENKIIRWKSRRELAGYITKIKNKSQIEVDQIVKDFLDDIRVNKSEDLVKMRSHIQNSLEFRPYNKKTKGQADSMQWKRTASEIIKDGYVYEGKACSDLTIVFLSLCNALGIKGELVKLVTVDKTETHSIVEVDLKGTWYRLDVSNTDSVPFEGRLTDESIWFKKYKVWKKGRDNWDLGLYNIESENKIYE